MHSYTGVLRPTSACVRFVRKRAFEDEFRELTQEIERRSIRTAYVKFTSSWKAFELCDAVALAIGAAHAPYGEPHWVRLFDDMITLSSKLDGLLIVIDNGEMLFDCSRDMAFSLIEAFLIQFENWLRLEKPCCLCFQMIDDPLVQSYFSSSNHSR